jgi:outer membrane protein assembly factor BamB
MRNCPKHLIKCLVAILLVSCLIACLGSVAAQNVDSTYIGTEKGDDPPSIIFAVSDNSTVYTDSNNLYVEFSVYLPSYEFMSFGGSLYSVSYKASWQSSPVTVYSWSYHDPADTGDDDPNPQQRFTYKIALSDAPVGHHQITATATGGVYALKNSFTTYTILTSTASSTLNFNKTNRQPTTPQPTTTPQSGILWTTNIPWNLANTPARDLWSSEIDSQRRSWTAPVIVDGVLYAGATSEVRGVGNGRWGGPSRYWINIYAFNISNGHQIWTYQATFQTLTNLAFSDCRVFFGVRGEDDYRGDTTSSLFALNATNGDLLWKTLCPYVYGIPVVGDGAVFTDSAHSILAFDGASGRRLWNFTANDFFFSTPTTTDGVVYGSSSTNDHTFYALNTGDGSVIWSISGNMGSATAVDGAVYVPSDEGNIFALNTTTGAEMWRYNATEFDWGNYTSHSIPVYDSGVVYLTSYSEQRIYILGNDSSDIEYTSERSSLLALDSVSGNKIWNNTLNNYNLGSSVTLYGGVVYTQNWKTILGFNSQNGALIWNYTPADSWLQTQPSIANHVLYVDLGDGQISALNLSEIGTRVEDTKILGGQTVNPAFLVVVGFVVVVGVVLLVFWIRSRHSKAALYVEGRGWL